MSRQTHFSSLHLTELSTRRSGRLRQAIKIKCRLRVYVCMSMSLFHFLHSVPTLHFAEYYFSLSFDSAIE